MKRVVRIFGVMMVALVLTSNLTFVKAQEEESSSAWSTGLDIYSSYIWRGAKFGTGAAFQPYVDFTTGGLSIGAWGSVNTGAEEAMEMDLYIGYSFDFGLSITVTDYYFGGDWVEFSANHYIEPMLSYEIGGFSIAAAYMLLPETEASEAIAGSPATVDLTTGEITPAVEAVEAVEGSDFGGEGDMYFEAGYGFENVSLTLGVGDGAYTDDGEFNVCNISVGTSKDIEITEKFTLPVSGSVTLNPSTGGFFIAVGVSF